ncbi:glycoside hydrolase family 1 protein [Actinophytocola oryzae]|uniref:beta-glucosidase n=1 Tax=Actinophytocola oryzae TaxID=502181 RepID=A0A4R7VB20_9PSEU|nr:family 1 glycosylhydrolase [Actinophytocola oryzae]TDV46213.1 beta-glucosidase [Actinophytocola oryzae]
MNHTTRGCLWGSPTAAYQKDLDLPEYRFSVSWPRLQPDGRGQADTEGLDHYERLVDELLAHGMTPVPTLHDGDLPQELEDSGGWAARDTAVRFAEYAGLVGMRLGDRVPYWTTLNEPWCAAFRGEASTPAHALRAAHHLLLAHGLGTLALRSVLPVTAQVSITLNLAAVLPAATSSAATSAVRRIDGLANRLFLDPLFVGHYPADVRQDTSRVTDWSFVWPDDLSVISTPIDLLGINYYSPNLVDVGPSERGPSPWPACENVRFVPPPDPTTAMGRSIDTQGLRNVVHRVHDQYRPIPLVVTENGAASEAAGCLRDHLEVVREAISAGVDLRGYFVWSLLDDYRQVIRTNGLE